MRATRFCVLAAAVPIAAVAFATAPAQASPGTAVYPGMEIRQGGTLCTLGYVDAVSRTAFTAGHCRGSGPVTDRDGNFVGTLTMFNDNTPDGSTITTDHQIIDWESIALAEDAQIVNVLPGGRPLVADSALAVQHPGQAVCHFGVVTGESCGTIDAVHNGWFTMANGVVSQKGDSGGPVYVLAPDGRAVIVGLFNSTWGQFPAAVSWQSTGQQIREASAMLPSGSNAAIDAISRSSDPAGSGVVPPM